MSSFNPRPSSFMGKLAWAATEARLHSVPFCPLAGERVGGCAVEWLSRSFDAMSPTHKFDVEVTDLATGVHTTFSVIRKQRTYRKTGKTTVRYNTPIGNFGDFDEVNAALVGAVLAAAEAAAVVVEEPEAPSAAEAPALAYPVVGVDVLAAMSLGRTQQIEQRHYAAVAAGPVFTLRVTGELLYFGTSEQKTELNLKEFGKLRAHLRREVAGVTDVQQVANALGQLHLDITLDGPKFMADFGAWDALLTEAREEQPDPEGGLGATIISGSLMEGGLEGLTDMAAELLNELDFDFSADTSFQVVEVAPDGPHAQPEQQQAQALAVAVAPFEPECRQCAALLDTTGRCPICPPPRRWEPCETGVKHAQTIPDSRHAAYAEHTKASTAARRARAEGAEPARQRRLDEASQDAWTAYRRWVDADSFAARAGAYDHLDHLNWRDY